jgi:hypothetical protein
MVPPLPGAKNKVVKSHGAKMYLTHKLISEKSKQSQPKTRTEIFYQLIQTNPTRNKDKDFTS